MNKNILKITTILCGMTLLPGALLAKPVVSTEDKAITCKNMVASKKDIINSKDNLGYTGLHYAAYHGNKDLADFLIANGANINATNENGRTALHSAVDKGNHEMVVLLLANGADINAANENGHTVLHSAVHNGNHEMVILLLANGANVDVKDKKGRTALDKAKKRLSADHHTVQLLEKASTKESKAQD